MEKHQPIEEAQRLFQQALEAQMRGDLEIAIQLYQDSIAVCPTAEAHTFLGWTYSFQGRVEEAIEECHRAIAVDPSFGNPYNDIGAYLIQLGRHDEAVPWLEKACRAQRYEAYHYPHYNLGRVYLEKEWYNKAREEFERALEIYPDYRLAAETLRQLKLRIQ